MTMHSIIHDDGSEKIPGTAAITKAVDKLQGELATHLGELVLVVKKQERCKTVLGVSGELDCTNTNQRDDPHVIDGITMVGIVTSGQLLVTQNGHNLTIPVGGKFAHWYISDGFYSSLDQSDIPLGPPEYLLAQKQAMALSCQALMTEALSNPSDYLRLEILVGTNRIVDWFKKLDSYHGTVYLVELCRALKFPFTQSWSFRNAIEEAQRQNAAEIEELLANQPQGPLNKVTLQQIKSLIEIAGVIGRRRETRELVARAHDMRFRSRLVEVFDN